MAGIMDRLFGNSNPNPIPQGMPQQQQMPQPGNLSPTPTPTTPAAPQEEQPQSLADKYKDLWSTPTTGAHKPSEPLKFNVDPKVVRQSAQTHDFSQVVTPELMAKINAGGQEAMSAMLAAMNSMSQEVLAQSALTNGQVLEAALEASRRNTLRDVPELSRRMSVSNALREDNPLFANPSAAPMLRALEEQVMVQFPNKSAQEIKEYARQYLADFADEISGVVKPKPAQPKSGPLGYEQDWSNVPT